MNGKRDCRCPRARHVHGTVAAYATDDCRCFPCRIANAQRVVAQRKGLPWRDASSSHPRCSVTRRLEALHAVGWSAAALDHRLGVRRGTVNKLRTLPSPIVYAWVAARVSDLYDELWDQPPPEGTRGERISVVRTRSWARRSGFLPPLAWDDETINDPNAEPNLGTEDEPLLDEVEVERFVTGHHAPLTGYAKSPELVEAIRRLSACGLSDAQVGDRVGISGAAVLKIRERHGIPAGVEPTYRVRRRTATGTERVA